MGLWVGIGSVAYRAVRGYWGDTQGIGPLLDGVEDLTGSLAFRHEYLRLHSITAPFPTSQGNAFQMDPWGLL